MVNFSINEYKDVIKFYRKPMPHNIHDIRKKAQMLLNNMLETNLTDHKKLIMKFNHRKNIHCKTLKKKDKI